MEDVYIINLRDREDKWDKIISNIKASSKLINPIRSEAIRVKPGWKGCVLSHMRLLNMAKERKLPYLIVWEDDTIIRDKDFDDKFSKLMKYLKESNNWRIFNGNPSNMRAFRNQKIVRVHNDPTIVSYEKGQTTNFIIYHRDIYDKILSFEKIIPGSHSIGHAIDNIITKLPEQKLTVFPYLTKQDVGKSDVENRVVNYDPHIIIAGENFIKSKLG